MSNVIIANNSVEKKVELKVGLESYYKAGNK
jgi:hypothetical protein